MLPRCANLTTWQHWKNLKLECGTGARCRPLRCGGRLGRLLVLHTKTLLGPCMSVDRQLRTGKREDASRGLSTLPTTSRCCGGYRRWRPSDRASRQ